MPPMFHNRTHDLAYLRSACSSDRGEMIILYGRRGVGKSALLARAVESDRHIFYEATRRTLPLQLEGLTRATREAYPDEFIPEVFGSFEEFLAFVAAVAERYPGESAIVVIDELPYLAESDPGMLTVLQHWWDHHKRLPTVKLFLAGSYVAFMEREVLDVRAPLYNRRTGQMKLDPLRYDEAALFFPHYTPRERIESFAVFGGMPGYLDRVDPERTLAENVLKIVLQRNAYLNREPEWLLLEDLRRDVVYGSMLRAIAGGNRKPSDIARAMGKRSAQDVAPQLETLRDLELVRREAPVTHRRQAGSRSSLYWLADNYLAFWYRYVDPNQSLIAEGRGQTVLDRINLSFHEYVSRPAFEEVCRQFLQRAYAQERLPQGLDFQVVGTWWNANSEIDIVAQEGSVTTLVGSCKWTNAPIGISELHQLEQTLAANASDLQPDAGCWFALFSREGFDDRIKVRAREEGSRIMLFSLNELFDRVTVD